MNETLKKELYKRMLTIRRVEEAIATEYPKQEMKCPIHLSIGQEAVPVGICAQLSKEDRVWSTHRCHAHYLAKGGSIPKMIAELYGKVTGCCKGKGGSMHLVDYENGMMGASALVGGTIPLAVGSALTFALHKKPNVSIAFFGDGGTEEGIFYESMNFASLKRLPVIFAVENNFYATYSHQKARQANTSIAKRGEAFNIPNATVDGNDINAVYQISSEAITRAKSGDGPSLIEFITYRWRDHVGPNFDVEVGYRTQKEVDEWIAKCPIQRLEDELNRSGKLSKSEKANIEADIKKEIETAFDFARVSQLPSTTEIFTDIYA
jgi:acetoin:2,6-dichlorophenolindophenol oxidoreductase subunit alpha